MRNFKLNSTAKTIEAEGNYDGLLVIGRIRTKNAPSNVSYTIEGEGNTSTLYKHEAFGSATPPYQEVMHK